MGKVTKEWKALAIAPEAMKGDQAVVLAALRQDVRAGRYADRQAVEPRLAQ